MHTHTQRHASFLTIPRATKHVFFFPLSAALSLAMVSTFDTLMCVTLTNRAEHIKRCGPDSAEIADWGQTRWEWGHCLYLLLWPSPPAFICFYVCALVGRSVCLFVWLRLLCGHSYAVETVASVAKQIHEQTGTKFPWFSWLFFFLASTHLPLVNKWLLAHWFGSSYLMNGHNLLFAEVIFFKDLHLTESLILPIGQN